MDSHTKKSFIATLRMFDHKVNLLESLYEKPALATVNMGSGGFYTGRPQTQDHSALLGIRPNAQGGASKPLKLLFRHTNDGYILSIKNTGEYYNKVMGERWLEVLGALDADDNAIPFTLIDPQNNTLTLDDLTATHSPISLRSKNNKYVGGLIIRGSSYVYLANTDERSKITFILSILERKTSAT